MLSLALYTLDDTGSYISSSDGQAKGFMALMIAGKRMHHRRQLQDTLQAYQQGQIMTVAACAGVATVASDAHLGITIPAVELQYRRCLFTTELCTTRSHPLQGNAQEWASM